MILADRVHPWRGYFAEGQQDADNTAVQTILDSKWHLFVKVADVGSVSGAALALDLPLSVVSRNVAQLERDAGARLFQRTGRGVVLTEFGQGVYPRIRTLIVEAEALADEMLTRKGMPIGDVRFGMLPSTVPVLAGRLFTEVRNKWPQVRLHLTEGSSAQLEEWLIQGRLDIAILLREDAEKPGETVIDRIPLYLVVPSAHPLRARVDARRMRGWTTGSRFSTTSTVNGLCLHWARKRLPPLHSKTPRRRSR